MAFPLAQHASKVLATTALMVTTAVHAPAALALAEEEVVNKLDTILLLMAVDDKGQPRPMTINLEGRTVSAYLGAMSTAAAEAIVTGQRYGISKEKARTLRFTPVSLARFNLLVGPLLKAKPADIGIIAPDPAQISVAEKLLVAQKLPAAQARQVADLQPMVFCPEPSILVSNNEGPTKGQQYVPCATDYSFVQAIVERARKESSKLAELKPRVVAIPLNNFVALLRSGSQAEVGALRVVPSGAMVKLIQDINAKQTTGTKP